jgi:hypothetical protein
MSRSLDYLAIPAAYCSWLGGLRWCENGEAVVYDAPGPEVGCTFAMSQEIALFLEGFQTATQPVCFGFTLHLLHLLGLGVLNTSRTLPPEAEKLARAFRETGRSLRNAGVVCGFLCLDFPRTPLVPDIPAVCLELTRPTPRPLGDRKGLAAGARAEVPPLQPAEFEARFLESLARVDPKVLRHLLKHGGTWPAAAGKAVARMLPKTLAAAFAGLEDRPRLGGAARLAFRLEGALALPPRRLGAADLPTGGYSDVATRGLPEQILPGQLALDGEEFVRRFAQRELLYFHREEPRIPVAGELVVVLDQGVRTWGDVRLVLAAALIALGRQAERRGLAFRIAATSAEGALHDPLEVDEDALGGLLEASDLTPHPARVLAQVLGERADRRASDVVLLTHPRSLAEPEVVAAARQAGTETRLFAVTAAGDGRVELAAIRQGTPVVQGRCRVELARVHLPPPPDRAPAAADSTPWRGDIEVPGFPFALGALGPIVDDLFDFDESGDWVLMAGWNGLLHAWRSDGTALEMLPRALVGEGPMARVKSIVGVAGGFVAAGRARDDSELVAAVHYDFATRLCTCHWLSEVHARKPDWHYVRELHSIVVAQGPTACCAIDLGVDRAVACYPPVTPGAPTSFRAEQAYRSYQEAAPPRSFLPRPPHRHFVAGARGSGGRSRALVLHSESGAIDILDDTGAILASHVPLADGTPALRHGTPVLTRSGGDVLATLISGRRGSLIYFFSASSGRLLGEHPAGFGRFALSRDGRRFAVRRGDRQIEVREVAGKPLPLSVSPKGHAHQRIKIELGDSLLRIEVGKYLHLIRWDRGPIEFSLSYTDGPSRDDRWPGQEWMRRPRPIAGLDGDRFVSSCTCGGLTAAVDFIGQVTLFGPGLEPICTVFALGGQIAAWMPESVWIGPAALIGGRETPRGAERIGAALRAAAGREVPR